MAISKSGTRRHKRRSRGSFIFSFLLCLFCFLCTFGLYERFYSFVNNEHTFPLQRISIKGHFQYITEKEIADVIGSLAAGKNLVSLDLAPIHNALVQLPWVSSASVSKQYPDMLVIELTEHHPSARWKQTGFYDVQSNSVFYPDKKQLNLPLVTLSAQHDSLAGELYNHAYTFMELTKNTPYNIEEVQLDAARGYRVRLEGDVWLILGRESSPDLPLIRLKRFLLAFNQTRLKLSDIAYVDLRYDNGFAVGERKKTPPDQENLESVAASE